MFVIINEHSTYTSIRSVEAEQRSLHLSEPPIRAKGDCGIFTMFNCSLKQPSHSQLDDLR